MPYSSISSSGAGASRSRSRQGGFFPLSSLFPTNTHRPAAEVDPSAPILPTITISIGISLPWPDDISHSELIAQGMGETTRLRDPIPCLLDTETRLTKEDSPIGRYDPLQAHIYPPPEMGRGQATNTRRHWTGTVLPSHLFRHFFLLDSLSSDNSKHEAAIRVPKGTRAQPSRVRVRCPKPHPEIRPVNLVVTIHPPTPMAAVRPPSPAQPTTF